MNDPARAHANINKYTYAFHMSVRFFVCITDAGENRSYDHICRLQASVGIAVEARPINACILVYNVQNCYSILVVYGKFSNFSCQDSLICFAFDDLQKS